MRDWGKNPPYQQVPCWVIADFQERDVGVIYTEFGYGQNGFFWNLAFLTKEYLDFGNNCCYRTLEDLVIDSGYFD
jgi:hypothetical protein